MPKVSVIMPTYNRSDLIGRAVESVLGQTFKDFELIVIDDGSTDETQSILLAFDDPRLVLLNQENSGPSAARNSGISSSKGEYIAFLDSDNYWPSDRLELAIHCLDKLDHSYALVYGDGFSINKSNEVVGKSDRSGMPESCLFNLLLNNFIGMNAVLARANVIKELGGFDPALRAGEDYDLWLRISVDYKLFYLPRCLCFYLVEGERISDNFERVYDCNALSYKKVFSKESVHLSKKDQNEVWARYWNRRGRAHASAKNLLSAVRCYLHSISYRPFSIRAWRSLAALLKR